jgi:hypothetical protein
MSYACPECGWQSYPPLPYTVQDGQAVPITIDWDEQGIPGLNCDEVESYGMRNIFPRMIENDSVIIIHKCPICNKEFSFEIMAEEI